MRVRMLQTRRGTEDGFSVQLFIEDQEYDIQDHLARAFFAAGFAIPAKQQPRGRIRAIRYENNQE